MSAGPGIRVGRPPRVVEEADRPDDGNRIRAPFLAHALGPGRSRPVVDAPVRETSCPHTVGLFQYTFLSLISTSSVCRFQPASLSPNVFCDGYPSARTAQSGHPWGHGDGRAEVYYPPCIAPFFPNPRHWCILPICGPDIRPGGEMEAKCTHPRDCEEQTGAIMRTAKLQRLRIRFLWP